MLDKPFVVTPESHACDSQIQDFREESMSRWLCSSCQSGNRRRFTAEINIHFPGIKGLDIPTVWVFPELLVCLDCGAAQFEIPDAERKTLAERDYRGQADGMAV